MSVKLSNSVAVLSQIFTCLNSVAIFFSAEAEAQELQWTGVRAVGGGDGMRCTLDPRDPAHANVFWTAAGGDISFVFTTFGLNLPKSRSFGGPLAFSTSCNVEADVTIPQGYYVRTLSQTLTVGVIKDKGSTGGISTNGFLFQNQIPLNQINLVLDVGSQVSNVLFTRTNTQVFQNAEKAAQCALTANGPLSTVFKFQMLGVAARPLPFVGLLLNLDGSDLNFGLLPTAESCARRD